MMRWVATVLLSCLVIAGFLLLLGENPIVVAQSFTRSLFSSSYDFGVTLFYTTILTFSGLAVAIAFRAGLFNIGAEGQLTLGAFAAA